MFSRPAEQLSVHSPEFSALWAKHVVRPCSLLVVPLRHPQVGDLTVTQQALTSVAAPHQVLVAATVEPTSASERALRLLGSLCTSTAPTAPTLREVTERATGQRPARR